MSRIGSYQAKRQQAFIDELCQMFYVFCIESFGITLYKSQQESARKMIESVFFSHKDIYVKMARQGGKTELITLLIRFLIVFFHQVTGDPFMVGIASPQGEQAKTDIDRIKKTWSVMGTEWQTEDKEFNKVTIRAYRYGKLVAEVYRFSLSPTVRNESKTLNLLLIEEAHKINDAKREDELDPMLVSTGGGTFFFGVGCTKLCDFKRGCDGEKPNSIVLQYDCMRLIADRREAYELSGDRRHLAYGEKIKTEIDSKGKDNPQVQRNYFLIDTVEEGGFISRDRLVSCQRSADTKIDTSAVYVGIDFGRRKDYSFMAVATGDNDIDAWFRYPHIETEDQLKMMMADLKQYKGRIMGIRGDSTGAGDFAMEWLMRHSDLPMSEDSHYVFGALSKHQLYTHFENTLFMEKGKKERFSYPADHPLTPVFEEEMINLTREYKGDKELLSVNHPKDGGTHDDAADATALSLIASASGKIDDIIF